MSYGPYKRTMATDCRILSETQSPTWKVGPVDFAGYTHSSGLRQLRSFRPGSPDRYFTCQRAIVIIILFGYLQTRNCKSKSV